MAAHAASKANVYILTSATTKKLSHANRRAWWMQCPSHRFTQYDAIYGAPEVVMESPLINHLPDCPPDSATRAAGMPAAGLRAVGYGKVGLALRRGKRVVLRKDIGPLISTEEMTRCIHCTRCCVRFGQEIGGDMELGMSTGAST